MRIAVLDFGYVEAIEHWGAGDAVGVADYERGIIEAARQSTQGSFRGWEQDAKLLAHLYKNNHATPFEFAGMVIEVRAPIFVFREWHRHRTQSYNEMSARYAPLPDVNYVPTVERLMIGGGANKQAGAVKDSADLTERAAARFQEQLQLHYERAEQLYLEALADGTPKELARLCLPMGRYSQMRAQASLRNWLAFLTLRMDPKAQWEIRQYANAVGQLVANAFPQTWALYSSPPKGPM